MEMMDGFCFLGYCFWWGYFGDEVYEMRFNKRENLMFLKYLNKIFKFFKSSLINVYKVIILLCGIKYF